MEEVQQVTDTQPINNQEANTPSTPDNSEILKNYESLVKQQQEQIQQLMKQQELNAKVNKQLGDALKQQTLAQEQPPAPKQHWVDEVINNDFVFKAQEDYSNETLGAGQVTNWYIKYLKEREGLSNEQVAERMKSIFEFMETGKQRAQTFPSEHDKPRPIPHEIKYR